MNNLKGYLLLFGSAATYGFYGVFSRLIATNFSAFSQNFFRNIFLLLLLSLGFLFKKQKLIPIAPKDRQWFAWWTIAGSLVMPLLFIAYNGLEIGTATFIFYATLTATGYIVGKFVFREKITLIKILSILLSLIGLLLIFSVSFEKLNFLLAAALSGVAGGQWSTLHKKISRKYSNFQLQFVDGIITGLVGFLGIILLKEQLPVLSLANSWLWLFLFAVAQIAGQGLMIVGYKTVEAQKGSLILLLEVIFASLFGALFFQEILPLTTFIGGSLILVGAILPLLSLKKAQ